MLAFFTAKPCADADALLQSSASWPKIYSWMGKPSKRFLLKTGRFLALNEVRSSSVRLMERDQPECDSRILFVLCRSRTGCATSLRFLFVNLSVEIRNAWLFAR